MTTPKNRQNGIDLLRILSMVLIVLGHYAVHGTANIYDPDSAVSTSLLYLQIITLCANVGSNCFFLMSGYFSPESSFKWRKLIKIVLLSLLFSFVFYFIFEKGFSIDTITYLFPIIFKKYWFLTAYVGLYLLSPYLKKLLKTLGKEEFLIFLAIQYVCVVFIPFLTNGPFIYGDFQFAVFMYSLGCFIKLYGIPSKLTSSYAFIADILLLVILVIVLYYAGNVIYILKSHTTFFNDKGSPFIVFLSCILLCRFSILEISRIKALSVFSGSTLGCYLIHENYYVKQFIWGLIDNKQYMSNTFFLILNSLVCSILVYLICSIISYVFIYIINNIVNRCADSILKIKHKRL